MIPRQILVTGNAGSGKSTLAKHLAKSYSLPYYSLDNIVWKENWQKTPKAQRQRLTNELIQNEAWVIDGVDDIVMAAADYIVFIDLPRRICFTRALGRNLKYLFKSRPELPAHRPEILILPTLIKIIWRFPKHVRPKVLNEILQRPTACIHLRSKAELDAFTAVPAIL